MGTDGTIALIPAVSMHPEVSVFGTAVDILQMSGFVWKLFFTTCNSSSAVCVCVCVCVYVRVCVFSQVECSIRLAFHCVQSQITHTPPPTSSLCAVARVHINKLKE